MAKKSDKKLKYNITFWQLFSIVVLAAILGGVIIDYAYDNQLFDEINSISFTTHSVPPTQKPPVKKNVITP